MKNPKLIIVSGLPGSGKSSLSAKIAASLSIPVFSVDPIESAIIKSGIKRSFETGLAAYLVAQSLAEEQLKLGSAVIIDAVNAEGEGKNMWRSLAKKLDANLIIIECTLVDIELHKRRIESRVRDLHGISEVSWDKVQARRKNYTEWEQPILKLDSSDTMAFNLQKALDYIHQPA